MKTLELKMKGLTAARRKEIEKRAEDLIAEEMTPHGLRHARKTTQVQMAKALGIHQDSVSRLEGTLKSIKKTTHSSKKP